MQDRPTSPWPRAAALLVWLVALDVWLKYIARIGTCAPGQDPWPWSLPEQCTAIDVGGVLAIVPAARAGVGPLIMSTLLERQLGALALLALTTTVTITVARARGRQAADVLAIACVWAGAIAWSGPCLLGPGLGLTELVIGGAATGIGDLALVFGLAWLVLGYLRE
ncbi:MAG TPA: hypothetical protein VG755_35065 [Nannocystaceae bacterium]|nr:hypothetical protein [Nannocystaceae bacterium]